MQVIETDSVKRSLRMIAAVEAAARGTDPTTAFYLIGRLTHEQAKRRLDRFDLERKRDERFRDAFFTGGGRLQRNTEGG